MSKPDSQVPDGAGAVTRERRYTYRAAGFDRDRALEMTGLEYMRALGAGELGATPPIAATIGFSMPFDLEHGRASVTAEPADYLLNPLGIVHGGFAATVLDTVLGVAVHTALPPATGYTTIELKVHYTHALRPDSGPVRADGHLVHLGRRIATSEGRLVGADDGRLYAHGTCTCLVFPLEASDA